MGAVLSRSGRQGGAPLRHTQSESSMRLPKEKKAAKDGKLATMGKAKSHHRRLPGSTLDQDSNGVVRTKSLGNKAKRLAFSGRSRDDLDEEGPGVDRSMSMTHIFRGPERRAIRSRSIDSLTLLDEGGAYSERAGSGEEEDERDAQARQSAHLLLARLSKDSGSKRGGAARESESPEFAGRSGSSRSGRERLKSTKGSQSERVSNEPTPKARDGSQSAKGSIGAAEFRDLRERGERSERSGKVPVSRLSDGERRRLAKAKDRDADKALRAALETALTGESTGSASEEKSTSGGLRSRRRGESAQELPPVKAVEEFHSAAGSPGVRGRSQASSQTPPTGSSSGAHARPDTPKRTSPSSVGTPKRPASGGASAGMNSGTPRSGTSDVMRAASHGSTSDEGPELEVPLSSLGSLETGEIRQIGSVERWQRGNLIGSGSYGKVYLGMNLDSGELFVVKQVVFANGVVAQGCPNQEDVGQLEQEIALLSTLAHDNIVKYLGTERNNLMHELSIFLEHMPGGSVADLVMRFGGLDESVIRKYTREVLEGLLYLHKKGIIHRDIKGQNILVDNRGVCKLADFGASRYLNKTADNNASFSFKGTPVFMSPEVITEQRYSRKSDVWSVGCTVLQMATGNPPYSEFSNHIAALFHITTTSEPPPIPEKMSAEGGAFILRCFKRDTSERATVDELLRLPFVKPSRASPKAREGQSPMASHPGQASTPPVAVESPKQGPFTPVSSAEGGKQLPELDEDRAWERWKERQWKEGTKTAVRLKRVHGSATVQPALQRRGTSHQPGSREMTMAVEQMGEFQKKSRPSSYSGAEALTRALQGPPLVTESNPELGELLKDTKAFPIVSPAGEGPTDAGNLMSSVHSSPDTSWGLQGKDLPPDPSKKEEEAKEKDKDKEEGQRGLRV